MTAEGGRAKGGRTCGLVVISDGLVVDDASRAGGTLHPHVGRRVEAGVVRGELGLVEGVEGLGAQRGARFETIEAVKLLVMCRSCGHIFLVGPDSVDAFGGDNF